MAELENNNNNTPPSPESTAIGEEDPKHSVSPARLEANRANAQLSTGPRTDEGKAISSRNRLSHGFTATAIFVLPDEDQSAFDALLQAFEEEHRPATPTEQVLVSAMARHHWLAERALRYQDQAFVNASAPDDPALSKQLALFLRYQTTHQRAFHRSLTELLHLRRSRQLAKRETELLATARARRLNQEAALNGTQSGDVQTSTSTSAQPAQRPRTVLTMDQQIEQFRRTFRRRFEEYSGLRSPDSNHSSSNNR